jgi:hypothetical protein
MDDFQRVVVCVVLLPRASMYDYQSGQEADPRKKKSDVNLAGICILP